PLLRSVSDLQFASLIEDRHPEFEDSLLTAVDLHTAQQAARPCDPRLAQETTQRALGVLSRIGEPAIVKTTRLRRWSVIAIICLMSVLGFFAVWPDAAAFYSKRIALSTEAWPRRVQLMLEGFAKGDDGVWRRRIARGDSAVISVLADLTNGHECPATVWLHYRFEDGPRGRESFARVGKPTAGENAYQRFMQTLADIRSDVDLRIVADDGRVEPMQIVVASRPVITTANVEVTPPDYLGLPTRSVPISAIGEIPEGSSASLQLQASKALASVIVEGNDGSQDLQPRVALKTGTQEFSVSIPPIVDDRVLKIQMKDTDGILSDKPHLIPLSVQRDTLPQVTLQLAGVGPAITPDALIGVRVELEDDHGVASAGLKMEIDGQATPLRMFDIPSSSATSAAFDATVDLLTERFAQGLNAGRLQPGQVVTLDAEAKDRCDLRKESRTTTSQSYTLQVITSDQLLARIEEREINLRRTFEQTVAEARRLERSVANVEETSSSEGESTPKTVLPTPASARLQTARLVDTSGKIMQETLSVGESFEAIHLELVHNRIQNEDLVDRIQTQIAKPLLKIGATDLPRLRRLLRGLNKPDVTRDERKSVSQLAAEIAEQMDTVLKQMQSLETYNEVLAMLRQVIDDQQRVRRATDKTRRDQVRQLLLE
ncbi:MAG: hypothetical protein AAGF31_04810, partial [Planctomycetota bacterium]